MAHSATAYRSDLSLREADFDRGLRKKGFKGTAKGTTTLRGKKMTTVEYRKRDGMTVGKVPRAIAHPFKWVASKFTGDRTSLDKNWRAIKREPIFGERTGRAAMGVLAAPLNFSEGFRREFIGAASEGAVVQKAYYNAEKPDLTPPTHSQVEQIDKEHPGLLDYMAEHSKRKVSLTKSEAAEIIKLGYTPQDNSSIRWMFDVENPKAAENRAKLRATNGHFFMPEEKRNGVNSFIFVPNGDFEKATSVKFWNAKDGSPVRNFQEQLRAINDYCATYDEVEETWNKEAEKIAITIAKREKLDHKDPIVIKELKKQVLSRRGSTAIDSKGEHVRIYSKSVDPNRTNTNSYRTGTLITLGKDSKTAMATNHNTKLAEHKKDLGGTKPFETPPPPPTHSDKVDEVFDTEEEW